MSFSIKKSLQYLLVFAVIVSFTNYQKSFSDLVSEKLQNYADNDWPEKVYVHTDKPYYSLGDDIWFSGYLVNGIIHTKSTKSSVVHVELIDANDSIVDSKKLFTDDIAFSGDFKIAEDWKEGAYLLRAYTNYMRNGSSEYFFQKELSIFHLEESNDAEVVGETKGAAIDYTVEKPDLQFYPEGGHLVENLRNKVAIKVKNDIYNNINLSCFITDEENAVISQFSTTDFGMGYFTFTPEPGKTYVASIEVNGTEFKYPLPKALPRGYVMNVTNSEEHFIVDVKSTMPSGLEGTSLVAHQRGHMLFNKHQESNKDVYPLRFSTNELKNGVVTLTLIDADGHPVCERLIFVDNPKNDAVIEIQPSKKTVQRREKITLNILSKDYEGKKLPSQLSMSVRDMGSFPHNANQENIKTWLLLNSDLRGEIKNPGYFFRDGADYRTKFLLDLVMMTHGWRRFTWQELLNQTNTEDKYAIETGITISGTTKQLKNPQEPISASTRLTLFGDPFYQAPVQASGKDGKFSFGPYVFFDSIPVMVESRLTNFESKELKDRHVAISIANEVYQRPPIDRRMVIKDHTVDEDKLNNYFYLADYIKQINRDYDKEAERLSAVTVVAKKKEKWQERQEEMNERALHGFMVSTRIDVETRKLDEYGFTSINEMIDALVPGGNRFSSFKHNEVEPVFVLNNMKVPPGALNGLTLDMISFIDVIKPPDALIYTSKTATVYAIFTRKGARVFDEKRKPGIIDFKAEGFYTAREFYAPDYSKDFENRKKADVRTTLHWEPTIRITEDEPLKDVSFYTSDRVGDYIVEIEGISDSGIPLHEIMTFSVQ